MAELATNWFTSEPALERLLTRQLGKAFPVARPRLLRMGAQAANEVSGWAALADWNGPRRVTHDREGRRIDDIQYHPAYRRLQEVAYGGGIVAASYGPALSAERGEAPKALTFGL